MHDLRVCPDCGHLVTRFDMRAAEGHHRDIDERFGIEEDPEIEADGYIIGAGPLPASVRGGVESEEG
jgi:hypothetical protein